MNIAMLSFRLPSPVQKRGGVERVAHDLANGLARRGHRVTIWSADPAPVNAQYQTNTIFGRSWIHHWLGFRLVSGFAGNILALLPNYTRAEAIIAHGDSLLLPLRGLPVLRVMHGSAWQEARTACTWPRRILQTVVYLQELITAATQMTIGISENARVHNRFVRTIVHNGVDTSVFYPDPEARSSHPSILFVGTLGGRKRGHQLMEWFIREIQPAEPLAELWMVSEPGPDLPGVRYLSGIPDYALARLYRHAWVYASPSVYEGFGLPYLEAMASGTPVVATANAGSREVLAEGNFGILIDDDGRFAAAVLELLRNAGRRAELTALGLRRSQELSLDRTAERYEQALESLIQGPHRAEARV